MQGGFPAQYGDALFADNRESVQHDLGSMDRGAFTRGVCRWLSDSRVGIASKILPVERASLVLVARARAIDERHMTMPCSNADHRYPASDDTIIMMCVTSRMMVCDNALHQYLGLDNVVVVWLCRWLWSARVGVACKT